MITAAQVAGSVFALITSFSTSPWGPASMGLPTRMVDGCVQGVCSGVAQSTTTGMFTHAGPAIKGAGVALLKVGLPFSFVVHAATVTEATAADARAKADDAIGKYRDWRKQIKTHKDATNETVTELTRRAKVAEHMCIVDAAHFMMPKYLATLSGPTYYYCAASYYTPWFAPRQVYTTHMFKGKSSWEKERDPTVEPLKLHGTYLHSLVGDCYPSTRFLPWVTHLDTHCTINADAVKKDMDALAAKEEKTHSDELGSHLAAEAKKAGETKGMLVSAALDAKQNDHLVAWWWVAPWNVVVMLCAWNVTRESGLLVALLGCMLQWATFVTDHVWTCCVPTWSWCVGIMVVRACREYPLMPPEEAKAPPPPPPPPQQSPGGATVPTVAEQDVATRARRWCR